MRTRWLAGAMVACLLPTMGSSPTASATSRASLPHALVLSASATPRALPAGGGTVTVYGVVGHASSCRLELLSRQSIPVVYASNLRPCRGSFTAHVTIGANNSAVNRTVAFALVASNKPSSFRGDFYITLSRLPPATVVSAGATPQQLGPFGGAVTVRAVLKHARTCRLKMMSRQGFVVDYASNSRPCTSSFTAHVVVGPNTSTLHRTVAFDLIVSDGPSRFAGQFFIGMAGSADPAPPVTTTTLPPAGTTTVPPSTTVPPPATTTTAPGAGAGVYSQASPNWAGYAVTGGPFSAVTGTFTIPALTADATCGEALSQWVGIDGQNAENLPRDDDLIQAGISEGMTDPTTGVCTAGQFSFWAWWEILPDAAVPVQMTMSVGDSVTVTIGALADGNYGILIQDNTNGQEFVIEQPYFGSGSSAEWIVEAPVVPSLCGVGEAPSIVQGLCPVAPFAPVVWAKPKVAGTLTSLYQIYMVQGGQQVAMPSELSGSGFIVNYTGAASDNVNYTGPAQNTQRFPALVGSGKEATGDFLHPVYQGWPRLGSRSVLRWAGDARQLAGAAVQGLRSHLVEAVDPVLQLRAEALAEQAGAARVREVVGGQLVR